MRKLFAHSATSVFGYMNNEIVHGIDLKRSTIIIICLLHGVIINAIRTQNSHLL